MIPRPGETYHGFTASHDLSEAKATFKQRHGYEPAEAFKYKRVWWLGPVKARKK